MTRFLKPVRAFFRYLRKVRDTFRYARQAKTTEPSRTYVNPDEPPQGAA